MTQFINLERQTFQQIFRVFYFVLWFAKAFFYCCIPLLSYSVSTHTPDKTTPRVLNIEGRKYGSRAQNAAGDIFVPRELVFIFHVHTYILLKGWRSELVLSRGTYTIVLKTCLIWINFWNSVFYLKNNISTELNY